MDEIRQMVRQLSGRWGSESYELLCQAVELARQSEEPALQMKVIWHELSRKNGGKSAQAISRALARAALDIWERGDREALFSLYGKTLTQPPLPKDLIWTLAQRLRPKIRYHRWTDFATGEYGIAATGESGGGLLLSSPFTADRRLAEQVAQALSKLQPPLQSVYEHLLAGDVPAIWPEL